MLFTSYEFVGFVMVTALLYYTLPKSMQWKILLGASYIFYFVAGPQYIPFILTTTISAYIVTITMEKYQNQQKQYLAENKDLSRAEKKEYRATIKLKKKRCMQIGLAINLGILGIVKYTNFVIHNINTVSSSVGTDFELSFVNLIVPLGISFYTFQTLSYVFDIYNNRYEAEKNIGKVALFVSFFPQLVQGPISRFDDMSKTLYSHKQFEMQSICFAMQRILWGYFKKLVIADRALIAVNTIINDPVEYTGAYVFVGMMLYAVQLYADFSGGIDITIGVAELFGIKLKENFIRPYFSKSIKEYWNRWHITMGSWFTDYIFYPVSISKPMLYISKFSRKKFGDKIGKRVPVYLAAFAVWLTTGIWHGASWNFIVWGLTNCLVILVSQEFDPLYERFHQKFNVQGKTYFKIFQIARTIFLMSCIRTFDCYRDVPLTFKMLGSMFTQWNWPTLLNGGMLELGLSMGDFIILGIACLLLILVSMKQRKTKIRKYIAQKSYLYKLYIWFGLILAIIVFGIYGIGYEPSQFIYNQF